MDETAHLALEGMFNRHFCITSIALAEVWYIQRLQIVPKTWVVSNSSADRIVPLRASQPTSSQTHPFQTLLITWVFTSQLGEKVLSISLLRHLLVNICHLAAFLWDLVRRGRRLTIESTRRSADCRDVLKQSSDCSMGTRLPTLHVSTSMQLTIGAAD